MAFLFFSYVYLWAINTTYKYFINNYLTSLPSDFLWQNTPVQVYPLESMSKYLITPTPLLQTNYHSLVVLNSGSYDHQLGMEILHVLPPSTLFIQEGVPFSLKVINEPITGFLILIQNKAFQSILNQFEVVDYFSIDPLLNLDDEQKIWINNLCDLLYKDLDNGNANRKIGTGLLQALLYKLKELSGKDQNLTRQDKLAIQFKQLVSNHYNQKKEVTYYALELGVSANHLNRCVKAFYNKSCKQIIQEVSILQSQVLMFNTTLDIKEIAYKTGFDDPSYFSRLFKKITGKTPKSFKKEIMHDLS